MKNLRVSLACATALGLVAAAGSHVACAGDLFASPSAAQAEQTTDRLIVKLRDGAAGDVSGRIRRSGARAGAELDHLRGMSGENHVVKLKQRLTRQAARALAQTLAADPEIEFAEPDVIMQPMATPNDPMYPSQWHYFEPVGGINLPAAWDITTGSSSIAVAVIDTGIVAHADLAGRLLPGYDFIGDTTKSNDANGRDSDASDPGDYGCNGSASSWHGTHVAGTIGAASNNGVGVVGVNWVSKLVPVRVLGRCGGYLSDIIDGMRWAAGIDVPGVPSNPNRARVENLSLGGPGACSASLQSAINEITARGTVVVVAAGNSNADASGTQPASCNGVITVAATTRAGYRAGFSNYGANVTIAAPGGDGILSTLNSGGTTPSTDSYAYYQGTSMATPHVAGVASLILSANPSLTPAQVSQRLRDTARAFPAGSSCSTALCGAGIVDAAAAIGTATTPPPTMPPPTGTRVNHALQSNGAVASASSSYPGNYSPSSVINGDRRGLNWGSNGGWIDATNGVYPDWIQVDFSGTKTIDEISVFAIQDNYANPAQPDESMTFRANGIADFTVRYWDGASWITVPGGNITGNTKVWRKLSFAPVSASKIRVTVTRGSPGRSKYSRMAELEAWGR